MLQSLLGNMERWIHRPAHPLFRQTDLLHPEWLAVCCRSGLFLRTAETDVGANHNQGRPAAFCPCSLQRGGDRVDVIALFDSLNVPTESGETCHTIFGEGQFRAALDCDVVVGIEHDEFAQSEVTSL